MRPPLRPLPSLALLLALASCAEPAPTPTAPPPPPNAPLLGQPVADAPPGIGEVDAEPSSFTKLPGQQIPDERLRGEPLPAEAAMAESLSDLARGRAALQGDGVVLVAGFEHHGIPAVPADPNPSALPAGTPALVARADQRDPATTYAHCLGLLQACAERSGSMDACVERVPTCAHPRPWEVDESCCPTPCVDAYRTARAGGTAWPEAYLRSLINNRGCFPGLEAVYAEGSP